MYITLQSSFEITVGNFKKLLNLGKESFLLLSLIIVEMYLEDSQYKNIEIFFPL